jgi:regulator of nonsense transcripts 2
LIFVLAIRRSQRATSGSTVVDDEDESEEKSNVDSNVYDTTLDADLTIEELEAKLASMDFNEFKDGDDETKETKKNHPLDSLLFTLQNSYNRDSVDSVAAQFCYLNTKSNRERLIESLYCLHRSQLELIPYYARLTATLNQYMNEM